MEVLRLNAGTRVLAVFEPGYSLLDRGKAPLEPVDFLSPELGDVGYTPILLATKRGTTAPGGSDLLTAYKWSPFLNSLTTARMLIPLK